jgi:hypothetical protein
MFEWLATRGNDKAKYSHYIHNVKMEHLIKIMHRKWNSKIKYNGRRSRVVELNSNITFKCVGITHSLHVLTIH